MALEKQSAKFSFGGGLDSKTDPKQLQLGRFTQLSNSVFTKGGLLQKRNGYGALPSLPDSSASYLGTFAGGLTAIGNNLEAYSQGSGVWTNRGSFQPVTLQTTSLVRNNTNQSQSDSAVSTGGLVCTVYTDQNPANLAAPQYKYAVADVSTGQVVVAPTVIASADATYGVPRVFVLGPYFIILFTALISSNYHIRYIAITIANPLLVTSPADISSSYQPSAMQAFDAAVLNGSLYVAWAGTSSSGIRMAYLTSTLQVSSSVNPDTGHNSFFVSVSADPQANLVWVSSWDGGSSVYLFAVSPIMAVIVSPTTITITSAMNRITMASLNSVLYFYVEYANEYTDFSTPSNFTILSTYKIVSGAASFQGQITYRSVGIASKAFVYNGLPYALLTYQSPYQSTYFLGDSSGNVVAKLAYTNGGGYATTSVPSVTVINDTAYVSYLYKDQIQAVNKGTNLPGGTATAGVYSQLGINLAAFTFGTETVSAEIGNNLNLSGGFLWAYDGYSLTEQNFFLFPDYVRLTKSSTGGTMTAQIYYYQFCYEWTDSQGNAFRSAPSIPVSVTTTGTTSSVSIDVCTLRLTRKIANPVKIVGYRWSADQQTYYQFTSISAPTLNDPTVDTVTVVDKLPSSSILGNNILYTTGGVVEDVNGPASVSNFVFDNRLWQIDAEDRNLLWFSKQVIEATPVEMSDLLTMYVPPNTGAQGASGPLTCGAPMDDKAVLFKASAIQYFNGTGPDITGANSQYSAPVTITTTVGCSNPQSIVFQPEGLMFEFESPSGNAIWLLSRDLSTRYIGADVEDFTKRATIMSAVNIPGTNEVRFTLSSGITLIYDYYYNQWGSFSGVPAASSTLYSGLHTYVNSRGAVLKETPGAYLDGASPILISLKTGWINLAGLQGYQRVYYFYLLGEYLSPHKLQIQIAYDFNPSPSQSVLIEPVNFAPAYGSDTPYGSGSLYGGPTKLEQWQINLAQQKCQSFQLSINEIYDPSLGVPPGAGFTLSGINIVYGFKKGYAKIASALSTG